MAEMTIDELARTAGMTVRNVRAHQTRGLLPPPKLAGRTGLYGTEHLSRLRLISEMQGAGFNLASIKALLDRIPEGQGEEALRFEQALLMPWSEETPEVLTVDEVAERVGGGSSELLERALELGVLRALPDERFEVPSPSLLDAARKVVSLGIPLGRALDVLDDLAQASRVVADSFTRLFFDEVWRPFESDGRPEEKWPDVRRALERLRPIATQALQGTFSIVMTNATEEAFGNELAAAGETDTRRTG